MTSYVTKRGYDVTGSQVSERVAQTGLRLVRAFTRLIQVISSEAGETMKALQLCSIILWFVIWTEVSTF